MGRAWQPTSRRRASPASVFERELFPRPHVGESLVPSSTRVFKELDFLATMEEREVPAASTARRGRRRQSRSRTSTTGRGSTLDDDADIRFAEREQPGVDQDYTYHVDRGKFDLAPAAARAQLGAEGLRGRPRHGVDFDATPSRRVIASRWAAQEHGSARAHGGRRQRAATRSSATSSSCKVRDPVFDQYAIHTWFDGLRPRGCREERGRGDYIFIHFLPHHEHLGLADPDHATTITSIGVVTQKKNFAELEGDARGVLLGVPSASRPELAERAAQARAAPAAQGRGRLQLRDDADRRRPLRAGRRRRRASSTRSSRPASASRSTARGSRAATSSRRSKRANFAASASTSSRRRSGAARRTGTISSPSTTG